MNHSAGRLDYIEHHTFLTGPLVPGSVVIDGGANIGAFASAMVGRFPCRVVAVEPHPKIFDAIPAHERIHKVACALGGSDGRRRLQFDANPEAARLNDAAVGEGVMTDVRRLETIFHENNVNEVALVKLDIEGSELEVLESLSDEVLGRIAQFAIEFHDFAGYLTTPQVEAALAKLEQRGWTAIRFSRRFYGDTLIVNRRLVDLSNRDVWWMRHVSRNIRGIGRMVRSRLGGRS